MYNSLPWEEDITRVYVLRPVGTGSSEGVLLFPLEKGDSWCFVEAPGGWACAHFCVYCMGLNVYCGLGEIESKVKC